MPEDIKKTILNALDEYEAEFEARRAEFNDYSPADIRDFKRRLTAVRNYIHLA